jgi:hypothetical protein
MPISSGSKCRFRRIRSSSSRLQLQKSEHFRQKLKNIFALKLHYLNKFKQFSNKKFMSELTQVAIPLHQKRNFNGKNRVIKWDEEVIAEHDKERGSRYERNKIR